MFVESFFSSSAIH